jgi:acetyltransferase-like isoleucine patch superfamily enzyme
MRLINFIQDRLHYLSLRYRVRHLNYRHRGINVQLFNGSLLSPPGKIWLGNDIYIGPEARFWAEGGLVIHDNVIFGPRVTIFTSNHKVEGADFLPYGPTTELGEVIVFSNSWIGASSLILPGVRIGEGAVCAAGSVITKNVPPLAFVAGNPAEVKRYREPRHYLELKQQNRCYMHYKRDHQVTIAYIERQPDHGPMRHAPAAIEARKEYRLDEYEFEG